MYRASGAIAAALAAAVLSSGYAETRDWRVHAGWAMIDRGEALQAARAFAGDVAQAGGRAGQPEQVDGLKLGWSVAAAHVGLDMLRSLAGDLSTPEGRAALKLLQMLSHEDSAAEKAWRDRGLPAWKQALSHQLELLGVSRSEVLPYPPRLAIAGDGTVYQWNRYTESAKGCDASLTVRKSSGEAVTLVLDAQVSGRTDFPHLALTPDGARLYVATPLAINCYDTARLQPGFAEALPRGQTTRGREKPLWRYKLSGSSVTATSVAVTGDGKRVIWANNGAGLGHLDAATGVPLAHTNPTGFAPRPSPLVNAALSTSGETLYLPVEADKINRPAMVPGEGLYTPFEMFHKYGRLHGWLALDAATGGAQRWVDNPWAPAGVLDGPVHNTQWEYTHMPPGPFACLPEGRVCMVTPGGQITVVDPDDLRIIAHPLIPVRGAGKYEGAAWGVGDRSVRVPLSNDDYDVARVAYELSLSEPRGLSRAIEAAAQNRRRAYLTAIGTLSAAVVGLSPARAAGNRWLQTPLPELRSRTRSPQPHERVLLAPPLDAWHELWRADLRYLSFEPSLKRRKAPPKPAAPLITSDRLDIEYVRLPCRFKPRGVEVTSDDRWLCVATGGAVSYVDADVGQACFEVSLPAWADLVAWPGTDIALAPGGAGRFGLAEIDLCRARVVRRYEIGPIVSAIPAGAGRCLLEPMPSKQHDPNWQLGDLWLFDRTTGAVDTTLRFPREGKWVPRHRAGCVGFAEDGSSVLLPGTVGTRPASSGATLGWAEVLIQTGEFVRYWDFEQMVSDDARVVIMAARTQNRNLPTLIPASAFPRSDRRWTLSHKGDIYLANAGATRLVHAQRVTTSSAGAGSGGTTTTITIFR